MEFHPRLMSKWISVILAPTLDSAGQDRMALRRRVCAKKFGRCLPETASSDAYERLVPGRKSKPRAIPFALGDSMGEIDRETHRCNINYVYNILGYRVLTPLRYGRIHLYRRDPLWRIFCTSYAPIRIQPKIIPQQPRRRVIIIRKVPNTGDTRRL